MALPDNVAFIRSPHYVGLERADLQRIVVELYVYNGTLTVDKPASPQYTLRATAFEIASGNNFAEVDVARYARDYVEVEYTGTNISNAVWIEYNLYYADVGDASITLEGSYSLTGIYGYGYFADDNNPTAADVLQSSDYVIVPLDGNIDIPVLQDDLTDWTTAKNSVQLYASGPLTPAEETDDVIVYANTGAGGNTDADRIILSFDNGTTTFDRTIKIFYHEECRNDNIKVTFVNRYGALQELWFSGKVSQSLSVESEKMKRHLRAGGTYNTKYHQDAIFEKNGRSRLTLNSGFYPEDSNGTFHELLLSEKVWVTVDSNYVDFNRFAQTEEVYPVNIVNSEMQFKTRLNDQLINYTIQVEFASSKINNVR